MIGTLCRCKEETAFVSGALAVTIICLFSVFQNLLFIRTLHFIRNAPFRPFVPRSSFRLHHLQPQSLVRLAKQLSK